MRSRDSSVRSSARTPARTPARPSTGSSARSSTDSDFLEFAAARTSHLFHTALLLTGGDWHRAEDLVQEVLAKLFVSWRRVDRERNPAAYAQTTLVRTFVSQSRRKSSTERSVAEVPDHLVPGPSGGGEDSSLRLTLLGELAKLGPKDRAVLVLRYWEDRSVEDAAAILGVSSASVRSQSLRALTRLRTVLGDGFPELIAN